VWARYVVKVAIDEFVRALPSPTPRPKRVLDAGSGPGVSLPLLDAAFQPEEIVAIDANPAEVERSRRQAAHCRCRVDVRRGDAAALDFGDGVFDVVLCHQLLHHVVRQEQVLREFHRVLTPGGILLVAESCRSFILSTPVRLLFRHPEHVQKTAAEYEALVRGAGFHFGPEHVAVSTPFWSKVDWGLRERLGWRRAAPDEPTEITLVAFKAAAGS
jgi:ubiquinone/menaquinone biosynthesis C-methylase UbiE